MLVCRPAAKSCLRMASTSEVTAFIRASGRVGSAPSSCCACTLHPPDSSRQASRTRVDRLSEVITQENTRPGLPEAEIVLHVRDSPDRTGDGARLADLGRGSDEAAQLHNGLVGLDCDLCDLERTFFEDRRLHLCRDRSVVDVFTGAFLRRRARASDGDQHRSCNEDREKPLWHSHEYSPEDLSPPARWER